MTVCVNIVGKCTGSPPTRCDLLGRLRQASPRGYHAMSSYLWTEDNFFSCLTPLQLAVANSSGCRYYVFAADWSCGGNDEDVRVAMMALLDLTAAVDDMVALVTERDGPLGEKVQDNEEVNVLLLELADVVEQSEECRSAYLRRWGAAEHNYHRTMVHRVMLAAGSVYVVPLVLQGAKLHGFPVEKSSMRREEDLALPVAFLNMDARGREKCCETAATEAIREWADGVARVMREESWHLAVVAVPVSVAELLDVYPKLVHSALLHHSIRQPLHWISGGKLAPTTSIRVKDLLRMVTQEYRILVQNKRYVRMPLRMPRYIFAHFFCSGRLPHSVMAGVLTGVQLLSSSSSSSLALAAASTLGCGAEVEANEEEILLGLQLTIALHRLRCEVCGPHAAAVEQFLKDTQTKTQGSAGAGESADDVLVFAQRNLERVQRRVMPVSFLRGHSIDWMRNYAEEAAISQQVTERELGCFDEYMLNCSEGDTSSKDDEEGEGEEEEKEALHEGGAPQFDGGDDDVLRHVKALESELDTRVRDAFLGSCHDEESALGEIAGNILLSKTLQMLSCDGVSGV